MGAGIPRKGRWPQGGSRFFQARAAEGRRGKGIEEVSKGVIKMIHFTDFPGGPVVKTPCF